jgi:outer membrane immunogenic protein
MRPYHTAKLVLAAAFGLSAAGTARAQAPAPVSAPPQHTNWSGPYVGAMVGRRNTQDAERAISTELDVLQTTGSVVTGYNWQYGPLVAGIEGEISRNGSSAAAGGRHTNAIAKARFGFSVGPALLYVTRGVSWTRDYGAETRYYTIFDQELVRQNTPMSGRAFGGGAELMLSSALAIRGEVQYVDYGSRTITFPPKGYFPEFNGRVNYSDVTMQVGVVYRPNALGGPAPVSPSMAASWQGAYVGVQGGVALRNPTIDTIPRSSFSGWQGIVYSEEQRTLVRGGHAGHLWQFGSMILGAEGTYDVGEHNRRSQMLLGRLGFAHQSTLYYASAGIGRTTASLNEVRQNERIDANHIGAVFGLGLETRLSSALSLRLQALLFAGNRQTYNFNGRWSCMYDHCGGAGAPPLGAKIDDQQLTLGLSYHFQ